MLGISVLYVKPDVYLDTSTAQGAHVCIEGCD